jgi:hypothetical protein
MPDSPLSIYTLYDNPSDMLGFFVVRRYDVFKGYAVATHETWTSMEIDPLRERLERMGLQCIPRSPGDDPQIVESWL